MDRDPRLVRVAIRAGRAVRHFRDGSRFVEVGNYLGRSLCSLGEVVQQSRKHIQVIGVDTCRGSGVEGPRQKDYHGAAVAEGGFKYPQTLALAERFGYDVDDCSSDGIASRYFAGGRQSAPPPPQRL